MSRFRRRLAERYGVASTNVHAHVIGEHGDRQIPVLSSARVRIIRAILRDEDVILTVSSRVPESMELDVSLPLPSIVNPGGIARVLSVPLNSSERKALEASAEVVKRNIATLAQTIPIWSSLSINVAEKTVRKCFLACRH